MKMLTLQDLDQMSFDEVKAVLAGQIKERTDAEVKAQEQYDRSITKKALDTTRIALSSDTAFADARTNGPRPSEMKYDSDEAAESWHTISIETVPIATSVHKIKLGNFIKDKQE